MKPSTYYTRLADWRWTWLGLHALRPDTTSRFPVWKAVLMAAVYTLLWITFVFFLIDIIHPLPGTRPEFYDYRSPLGALLVVLGAACSVGHWLFTRLFWNQRVRGQATKEASHSRAPRWTLWIFSFIYIPIFSLATPVAAIISLENIWGSFRWHQVRNRLESAGEKLDFSDWDAGNVPTEKNINGLPIFQAARQNHEKHLRSLLNLPERYLPRNTSNSRATLTLEEWAAAYQFAITQQADPPNRPGAGISYLPPYPEAAPDADPATIVLQGLSVADVLMEEICAASHLPFLRSSTDQGLLDLTFHFSEQSVYRSIARFLRLRIKARLNAGESEAAMADLQCAMRLAVGMERKLLIEYLLHLSLCHVNALIVWDGIEQHGWDDDQLVSIQKQFEKMEFHEPLLGALAFERNWGIATMDEWSNPPVKKSQESPHQVNRTWPRYALRGWTRLSQVAIALTFDEWITPARSWHPDQNTLTGLEFLKQMDTKILRESHSYSIHHAVVKITLPAYEQAFKKSLKAKHAMQSAGIACALERYYIANQSYPKMLDALVPAYLKEIPRDIMDRSILKYERTKNGFIKLWSIGDDGVNNGGDSKEQIDWVWPME